MKILLPITMGAALLAAGCASVEHEHDTAGNDHHATMQDHHQSAAGGHDNMAEGHMTEGHMEGGHMQGGHKDGGHMAGGHAHGSEGSLAGEPGKASEVSRTINVTADDTMRFTHKPFDIKDGETIKFVVTNQGAIPHEFSIGTKDEHMEHGAMMMKNPNMHHGPGGNSITVKPGETAELLWKFENAWQIQAACNIPGHYQAGMHSSVKIEE